ncbi:unnamed protein product [Gongylonema pulchrum]|uniref:Nicastrin n=1 Tax=Gongylonema pulchrum TaxID=637853 RepID=A0A3P7N0P3_9BILA|nr:unnamed protein product [Gongylonema pulchrum]
MLQAANATLSEKASGTADIEGPSAIHVVKNAQIPPSCYQSFLKKRRDIAGFVLCPFDQRYIYNRINSLTDQNVFGNDTSALREQVMAAANAVLGAVLEFLTGSNKTHAHLLGRYDIDEQYVYHYTWQYDPEEEKFTCYRNSLYLTDAQSPAFADEDYNMQSGVHSTWVESVWAAKQFRLFLTVHPYPMRDAMIFMFGVVFFILSYIIMQLIYLGNKEAIEPSASLVESDNAAPL